MVCKRFGPPSSLVFEDVASLKVGDGQVLLEVRACGVNFPDTLIIEGKYQFKPDLPFSPGGEVAGIVKEVGAGITHVRPGDRVIATMTWGGYAQEAVAPGERVVPLPENLGFEAAAGFLLAYGTSHHALKDRAALRAGETLLVLGAAGGVGLAAIDIAKLMGARVIAAASSDEKLEACRERGADSTINYAREDLRERLKALTGSRGVDVVYDPVGGDLSEPALRSMRWNGRFLVVGFAAGRIPTVPLNLPLLKGCAILGVFYGGFVRNEATRNEENLRELAAWVAAGKLRPRISAVYPLERAAQAMDELINRKVIGKVVLTTGL